MITKCMLRGGGMNSEAANLASGGSEFSDSSSSVSIDDFPPNFGASTAASAAAGLLAMVTPAGQGSRLLSKLSNEAADDSPTGNALFENDSTTTMVTLMEASDCEDFPGKFTR